MKKLLTSLMLLCMMCTGAWAQTSGFRYYRPVHLSAAAEGYFVIDAVDQSTGDNELSNHHFIYDNNGNFATAQTIDSNNFDKYVWHVTANTDGTYKFKNVGTSKCISIGTGNSNGQALTLTQDGTGVHFDFASGYGSLGNGNNQWYDCGNAGTGTTTWGDGVGGSRRMRVYEALTYIPSYTLKCKKTNNYATYNTSVSTNLAVSTSNTYHNQVMILESTNNGCFRIRVGQSDSKYIYAINTDDADSNVGVCDLATSETGSEDKYLWKIKLNTEGYYNIIPKAGNRGWNVRGTVSSVGVIGQWGSNSTDDNRWVFAEAIREADFVEGTEISLYNSNTSRYVYCSNSNNQLKWQEAKPSDDRKLTLIGDNTNGFILYCKQHQKYVKDLVGDNNITPLTTNSYEAGVYKFEKVDGGWNIHNLTYTGSHQYMHINTTFAGVIPWNASTASGTLASKWNITLEGRTTAPAIDFSGLTEYDENVNNAVLGYAKDTHPVAEFVNAKNAAKYIALHKFLHTCRESSRSVSDAKALPVNTPSHDKSYYFRVDFSDNSSSRYLYVNADGNLATTTEKPSSKKGRWRFLEDGKIQNVGSEDIYLRQNSGIIKSNVSDATNFTVSAGVKYGKLALSNGSVAVALSKNGTVSGGQYSNGPFYNMSGEWSCDFYFEEVLLTEASFTYNYKLNGNTVATQNFVGQRIGQDYPAPSLPYGVAATAPSGQVTADDDDTSIDIECTLNDDNEIAWAEDFAHVTWLGMKMRGGYMYSNAQESASSSKTALTYLNYKDFEWGFIGNPFSFKIVNRSIGEGKYLTHNGNDVTYNATGDNFRATTSTNNNKDNGKFVIEDITSSNMATLHSTNSGNQYALWVWTSGSAIGDAGSQVSIKNPETEFLATIKSTAAEAMPDYAEAINSLTSCDEVAAYIVPVTYTLKGYWSETELVDLGEVSVFRPRGSQAADVTIPSLSYYTPDRVVENNTTVSDENKTFTLYCTPNFPFTVGNTYTMRSDANGKNNYVSDDNAETKAWYNNSVAVKYNSDIWVFEHVANTQNIFTVKNYGNSKYLTIPGSGRNAATLEESATTWASGTGKTSYFRITPNGQGFNLQHPGDANTNVGSHVDNMVGSWQHASSNSNAASRNFVTAAEPVNWNGLNEVLISAGAYTIGEALGQYHGDAETISNAQSVYEEGTETKDNVDQAIQSVQTAIAGMQINDLPRGKFYRFKIGEKYMSNEAESDNVRVVTTETNTAKSVYYLTENSELIAYADGFGFNYGYCKPVVAGIANTFAFSEGTSVGSYNIHSYPGTGDTTWSNRDITISGDKLSQGKGAWVIEEVTELPVTIGSTKFATFYTPVELQVPAGVTAYVCNLNGDNLAMYTCKQTVGGHTLIPAGTAVMLNAPEQTEATTTYDFTIPAAAQAESYDNNSFFGDVATKTFESMGSDTYYSLQKDNEHAGQVGFFIKPSGNFKGFQAFLSTPASQAPVQRFNVTFDEDAVITGIANVLGTENITIPAFDLSGRKVDASSHRGLYIMNGKKVIR